MTRNASPQNFSFLAHLLSKLQHLKNALTSGQIAVFAISVFLSDSHVIISPQLHSCGEIINCKTVTMSVRAFQVQEPKCIIQQQEGSQQTVNYKRSIHKEQD